MFASKKKKYIYEDCKLFSIASYYIFIWVYFCWALTTPLWKYCTLCCTWKYPSFTRHRQVQILFGSCDITCQCLWSIISNIVNWAEKHYVTRYDFLLFPCVVSLSHYSLFPTVTNYSHSIFSHSVLFNSNSFFLNLLNCLCKFCCSFN